MDGSLFITFEGPEGGGKTTQISLLQTYLESTGLPVLVTRQPGGDPVGIELRKIMLDLGRANISIRAELLLMMADRSQSVDTVIQPFLTQGGVVICDRYSDSSVAYQGGGRGIDIGWINRLNSYATNGLSPDITFLLDIDPLIGLTRQQDRNRMEELDLAFHERVRTTFLALAEQHPNRIYTIDASHSVETVHSEIRTLVDQLIKVC